MSNQETVLGKLKKLIPLENESLEDQAKRILNKELNTRWYNTYLEELLYDSVDKYIVFKDDIYEIVVEYETDDDPYFCHVEKIGENEFSFATSFYNGGTYLEEMLNEGLNKCYENL